MLSLRPEGKENASRAAATLTPNSCEGESQNGRADDCRAASRRAVQAGKPLRFVHVGCGAFSHPDRVFRAVGAGGRFGLATRPVRSRVACRIRCGPGGRVERPVQRSPPITDAATVIEDRWVKLAGPRPKRSQAGPLHTARRRVTVSARYGPGAASIGAAARLERVNGGGRYDPPVGRSGKVVAAPSLRFPCTVGDFR
jgi:hypothetical protein